MGIRQYGQAEVLLNPSSDENRSHPANENFGFWGIRLCHGEEDGERLLLRKDDVVSFYRCNGVERKIVINPSFHRCWVPFGATNTVMDEMPQWLWILPVEVRWFVIRLFMIVFSIKFSAPMFSVWSAASELVWVGSIASNPPSTNHFLARFWSWRRNMMLYLIEGSPMAISKDGLEFSGSGLMRFAWFPADISPREWVRFFNEEPPYRITLDRTLTFRCD